MQNTPGGWVGNGPAAGGTGSRSQRWTWTHRYGVPLLLASIVAVVLAGSGLVAMVTLGGGTGGPGPGPTTDPPASPIVRQTPTAPATVDPTPTGQPVGDTDCLVGTWRATTIVDVGPTGTFTMISGEPTVAYREDGTGAIDYGTEDSGTTFEFEDTFLGSGTSTSDTFGVRGFTYVFIDGAIDHTYDLFGGPKMLGLPYFPSEDRFTFDCAGDTMTLDGENGHLELVRLA